MERQPDKPMEPGTKHSDYIFRRAQETDFPGIVQFFKRHDFGPTDLEWLKWKYMHNPDGPALVYVAEDSGGAIVCTIVHLSRLFTSSTTGTFLMRQNIDMLVDAKLRGQRIYSRLGKLVKSRRDYMMIGFPNEFSARTIKEESDTVIPLEIWRFPVSMGQSLVKKSRGIAVEFINLLCRLYALCWLGRRPNNVQMKPVERFSRNFDLPPNLIGGVRSAAYLNWRFIDNPEHKYSAYEFLEGQECVGYCVFEIADSTAEILDFIVKRRRRACLKLLVEHCRAKGIGHLSFCGVGLRMGKTGFLRRDSGRMFVLTKVPNGPPVPEGDWFITLADKD